MTHQFLSEEELAAFAAALAEGRITAEERALIKGRRPAVSVSERRKLARDLVAGMDQLGTAFTILRSPELRRENGATYTPNGIIETMLEWAARQKVVPVRIVDVGAGSGRYAISAAMAFHKARVIAIEKDPLAALVLRANVALAKLSDRVSIRVEGYHETALETIDGPTLYIGNPPYIRHHDIAPEWKTWYSKLSAEHGVKASQLAGLHLHFFLKTLDLAKAGDIGCFITAAEWLDVNYGEALRKLLVGPLGLRSLDVIDPKVPVFDDAMTSAVITAFEIGARRKSVPVRLIKTARLLSTTALGTGPRIKASRLAEASKWGPVIHGYDEGPTGGRFVGDLFRVRRGQVTGNNSVWVVDPDTADLPETVLRRTVTRARELFDSNGVLRDDEELKAVVDLPADLDELSVEDRRAIRAFLKRAQQAGADQSYIARHRRPWFAVKLHEPAPILCTYMARRAPAFVINSCRARHINIAHGLYPKAEMDADTLAAIVSQLNSSVDVQSGRTYAGGLTKFEPGEVERLPLLADPEIGAI